MNSAKGTYPTQGTDLKPDHPNTHSNTSYDKHAPFPLHLLDLGIYVFLVGFASQKCHIHF